MKKKITGTVLLFFTVILSLSAQTKQRISIGEKIPNIRYNEVIHYTGTSIELSDFQSKAIILNLWNTRCEMAIKAMIAMDSIQQTHPDDLVVLGVSGESAERINQYIDTHTLIKRIRLPNVVNDTITNKLIPHWVEPLLIYIDKGGVVKAISAFNNYQAENVLKLIRGDDLNLPDDTDETPVNIKNAIDPLIFNDYTNRKNNMLSYSYVSNYQDNVSSRGGENRNKNGVVRIFATNLALTDIYAMAYLGVSYRDSIFYPNITIRRRDTKHYITHSNDIKDTFCFEQISRDSSVESAREKVPQLLDNSLGLTSSLTRENVKCWILREIKNSTIQKQLANKKKGETYESDGIFYCKNGTVMGLIPTINIKMLTPIPIYNELGRKRVTFKMPLTYHDRETMDKALNEYGLELVEEMKSIPIITLLDR